MPKRFVRMIFVAASLGGLASPALAAAKDLQAARMEAAFNTWVEKWGVQNASLAIMRGAKLIGQGQAGDYEPDEDVPVASLSKAITGVCVARLVEAKQLKYSDTIGKLLKPYFKANKPADSAAKQITVAELLTQTSGIAFDPTQGTGIFSGDYDLTKTNMPEQLTLALQRPLGAKTFFYNNINYDALGMVIEAVTDKPYESYCAKTVLKPAGAKAKLNAPLRILNAYGGWKISAVDYARFLDNLRPGSKLMKSAPNKWPQYSFGNGAYYSIGMFLRQNGSSYNFWHDGAFSMNSPLITTSFGSYFAMWAQDLRFAATYAPRLPEDAVNDLDYVMYQAAYSSQKAPELTAESGPAPLRHAR